MYYICVYKNDKDMTYQIEIAGFTVEIEKRERTRTQIEWIMNIYMVNRLGEKTLSIHSYRGFHLTRKAAIAEAKRAILINAPRIERV